MTKPLALLLAALCLPSPVLAQTMTPIVRMNCAGTAWPTCGANRTVGNPTLNTQWERTYIPTEDAVELHMMPGGTGEGYYGWQWSGFPAPAAGATRVLRVKVKVMSSITWGSWGSKFMVVGDLSNDASNRIISTMNLYQNRPHLNVDKNIDGNYAYTFLVPDQYVSIQIVASPATAGTTGPYSFKYYADGVLVSTSRTFTINPAQWRDFNIGYYGQYQNGGNVRVRFKQVEFDDQYDPNYHTSGGTPTPPTCTVTAAGGPLTMPATGGTGSVAVTASATTCAWTASSPVAWATVAPTSGTGTRSVTVTAAANTGAARNTTVVVAGQNIAVSQGAATVTPPPTTRVCTEATIQNGAGTAARIIPCPAAAPPPPPKKK
jgi:hypothetical protein